ncbi:MAG: hypothetical protein DHS20C15_21410 [Planctomycetota bacterium]|nr:MAG: hypothetical protein DHS20C15_21410 [Planctomycetota bacterium]
MKHRLKIWLRVALAHVFHLTGLRGLFRSRRAGIPVLMFHNVGYPAETDYLPGHMKIGEPKLRRLLKHLARAGYRTRTMDQTVDDLAAPVPPADTVALTFDDGYRDNHDILLPMLREFDATATVYVQTGPMKGKLNWLHHYFWVLHKVGPHALAELLAEQIDRPHLRADLAKLSSDETQAEYDMKRLLKYEITAEDRERILATIFEAQGGDDATLARSVYLDADDCRALDKAGVELGAHTVNHLILSGLEPNQQRLEIEGSLRDLEAWLEHPIPSFAYPYGRSWDYDDTTREILVELGFRSSVTAMTGLNDASTPALDLKRIAVNQDSRLAEVLCEVDGVFAWLSRRGLDLRV